MNFFPKLRPFRLSQECLRRAQFRYYTKGHNALQQAVPEATVVPIPPSFTELGVRGPIASALHSTFPDVKGPTESQCRFIPALLSGDDLLLKDGTGTGKSFGLLMALLSKPRQRLPVKSEQDPSHAITSLFIVPHRDLAFQLLHWVQIMASAPSSAKPPSLDAIAQVLVRDKGQSLPDRIAALKKNPPHILLATPNALMEVHEQAPATLQLSTLSTVVVDEVDYLIDSVPWKHSAKMMELAKRKIERHPSTTRQILDIIYSGRVKDNRSERVGQNPRKSRNASVTQYPQLVMASATLRNHLKLYLYNESGWLKKDSLKKVVGLDARKRSPKQILEVDSDGTPLNAFQHCVLVVSKDGNIRNISGAKPAPLIESSEGNEEITPATVFSSEAESLAVDESLLQKYASTPSLLNPDILEAIATSFALDVPSIAMLVLPPSAPIQRAVYELRQLGVNAHGMDLMSSEKDKGRAHLLFAAGTHTEAVKENPTLLVSSLATTRGLDLPELTHVFIYGVPDSGKGADGKTLDAYLHIAGRVGRFGRGGKVVSVVEGPTLREEEATTQIEEGERVARPKNDVERIKKVFKELRLVVTQFSHFD